MNEGCKWLLKSLIFHKAFYLLVLAVDAADEQKMFQFFLSIMFKAFYSLVPAVEAADEQKMF